MLSIILPTYNRLYSLKSIFLPSLEIQDFLDYELIIVDDASTDETEAYFLGQDFHENFKKISKRYRYIKNGTNLGAPISRNKGVGIAKGDWIWIVEDDIEIKDTEFLSKFESLKNNISETVGVISPRREEGKSTGYYQLPNNEFIRVGRLSGEIYINPFSTFNGIVENTHCSSFIRKKLYIEVGGQDGITFYGNTFRDESDLYFRIVKKGFQIYYFGDIIVIYHRNDYASEGGQKKVNKKSLLNQEYMILKNHYYYLRKNYNLSSMRLSFFIVVRIIKISGRILGLRCIVNLLSKVKI